MTGEAWRAAAAEGRRLHGGDAAESAQPAQVQRHRVLRALEGARDVRQTVQDTVAAVRAGREKGTLADSFLIEGWIWRGRGESRPRTDAILCFNGVLVLAITCTCTCVALLKHIQLHVHVRCD